MSLKTYREKRDFKQTPEPAKGKSDKDSGLRFVVQRHKASRLHYDFRLEMEGVLKSWAVPKGPSLDPDDKRLAMQVEDHPYAYKDFQGVIPEGNYGAGIVEIWDTGNYHILDPETGISEEKQLLKDLKAGSLKIVLDGQKLQGEFALVKMQHAKQENAWLLIKHKDKYAVKGYDSEAETLEDSPINQELKREGKTIRAKKTTSPEKRSARPPAEEAHMEQNFGRIKVELTHLNKIYFPRDGIRKKDIIDYYQDVSELILPYLKNRPQSLKRNPNGIDAEGFFQKDAGGTAPEWVESIPLYSESAEKDIDYILCNKKATLAYLNNLGCIELNPWNSVTSALDRPDYLILDIDPSEKNTFDEVLEVALCYYELLKKGGAEAYCKTSGATGLHVYVPMNRKYTYESVRKFGELLSLLVMDQLPETTTMERSLKKRGPQIYLDYLQNKEGQTLASAYSVRPRDGAPVSTPLEWKEVKPGIKPGDYHIFNITERINKKGDLFRPVLGKGIDMEKCLKKLKS